MLPQPLILGILVFQVLYSLVQWYFFRRREYIYYAAYCIFIGLYFFLKYLVVNNEVHIGAFQFHQKIIDRDLVFLAICFYVEFGRQFIDSSRLVPDVDRKAGIAIKIMLAYTIINLCWYLVSDNHRLQEAIHLLVSIIAFVFFVDILLKVYRINKRLAGFLMIGSIMMGTGALCSLFFRLLKPEWIEKSSDASIFLQIGVILELICINTGLIYKSKIVLETNVNTNNAPNKTIVENEKLLSDLQSVRSEISNELKSELGDGLSGIKLMSDMVKQKMGDKHFIELERISENSERLIQSMNEIVWSLNHQNDNLPGMISYLREYAMSFMQQVGIHCNITVTEPIKNIHISSDARRHIFLAVKESLHNAIKHASPSIVNVTFTITDKLDINISDNGIGMEDISFQSLKGNGMRNMKKRMDYLGGNIHVNNTNGTSVLFSIPIANLLIPSNDNITPLFP
ncbi:MAG: 7TM diverse intracellular signaling domain-containing protein [Agriterribacter sp.]